ncbi:M20 family metallo-hydrolase [Anaerosinus massiliensis]|uniref:M20 family metallo-hydrolase n=1 Tax=Massilibacillus massiliensis TaxID=1806837 RepID=UPI000AF852F1|nr:M20 family metallo-hydrolase [Massilibacillus massiliensis]
MVSQQRLAENFEKMSIITAPGQGITRLAFSDEDWQARKFIIDLMENAGLTIRIDNFGNIIGRREGTNPTAKVVMMGSHIDSVPNGGNFDGVVGVLGAIEVINCMNEENFENYHPIEVVVFMAEESSRFGVATLGSKAMRGEMDIHLLKKLVDKTGASLYDVLKLRGLDADKIEETEYTDKLKAFMEIHIEQGKVLETTKHQLGIVTGIAAPTRLKVILNGQADHSGATPMNMRQDALCAAAEIILQVEKIAKDSKEFPVVGTTGIIQAYPGVMNVVPGKVELGIDIRSIYMETKIKVVKAVIAEINAIANERNLTTEITTLTNETPVKLRDDMISFLDEICKEKDYAYMQLPSGAGHDAMHWAPIAPTGMLFIPCKDGISHNPAESAEIKDIAAATDVLYTAIRRLSTQD